MAKLVMRIAGTVSYSDNSHAQFAVHLDERGNLSVNNLTDGRQAAKEVDSDVAYFDQIVALLHTITIAYNGTPAKVVTDLVAEISGRIANDDNTWGDFISQYDSKSGARLVTPFASVANFTKAVTAFNSTIDAAFSQLTTGAVTVA